MQHLIFIDENQCAIISAGLNELPGKHCNPVIHAINQQIAHAQKDPGKFVAVVEAWLTEFKARSKPDELAVPTTV